MGEEMKFRVESATLARVEAYWKALDEVARERRYLLFTEAPPLERSREFVENLLAKAWSQFYAVDGNEVVGWCDVVRCERQGMTHVGHLGMGVLSSYRGLGIGRRLLAATLEDAFKKGIERIDLEVFSSNQVAINLYKAQGFAEEGRKRNARLLDGRCDDFVIMALFKNAAEV